VIRGLVQQDGPREAGALFGAVAPLEFTPGLGSVTWVTGMEHISSEHQTACAERTVSSNPANSKLVDCQPDSSIEYVHSWLVKLAGPVRPSARPTFHPPQKTAALGYEGGWARISVEGAHG